MCVAVSSSKAVTSCLVQVTLSLLILLILILVQEEIRRDLAREVELRQEAKRRLQEDTSLSGDSLDGDERGRRRGRSKVSARSQSSHGERGKCTLEASPSRISPPPQLHQATPSSGRAAKALQSTQCMQNSSKQRGR